MKFVLRVRVEIVEQADTYNHFAVNEDTTLDLAGFFEVAQVLGKFHELTEALKQQIDKDVPRT